MKNWLSSGVVLMSISLTLYFSMGYDVSVSQMADVTLDEENVFSESEDVVEDADTLGEDEDLDDEELGSIDTAETQEVVAEVFSTELVEDVKTVSKVEAEDLGEGDQVDEGIDAADLGEKVFSSSMEQTSEEGLGVEDGPEVFSSETPGSSETLSEDEENLDEYLEDEEIIEDGEDTVASGSDLQTGGVFSSVNKVGTKDEVVSSDEGEAPKPEDLATVPPTETKKTSKKSPKAQRVKTKADEYTGEEWEVEIKEHIFTEKDEDVKLQIDNVHYVDPDEKERFYEPLKSIYSEKDEDIKIVYDDVHYTDPDVKDEFREIKDNIYTQKNEKITLRFDNVHYTNPDADKDKIESFVVRSIFEEREGNIVKDVRDAKMGIPYVTASYTSEESAKRTRFKSLGTPYTIRTEVQEELIRRGGY